MSKDRLRKSYKLLFIVLLPRNYHRRFLYLVIGKLQERRNREYEVSLVNA